MLPENMTSENVTSEHAPARQPPPTPPPEASKSPARKAVDQPVPWYGRLLIGGVLIGATIEFFRLLLTAIVLN